VAHFAQIENRAMRLGKRSYNRSCETRCSRISFTVVVLRGHTHEVFQPKLQIKRITFRRIHNIRDRSHFDPTPCFFKRI